jgi:hypothetical protein
MSYASRHRSRCRCTTGSKIVDMMAIHAVICNNANTTITTTTTTTNNNNNNNNNKIMMIATEKGCRLKTKLNHEEPYLLGYNAVSSVENQPTFRRNISPISSGGRIIQAKNQHETGSRFLAWFILRPWKFRRYIPPKWKFICNALHGVISRKVELFIPTAVRASNPTNLNYVHYFYIRCKT